MPSYLLDWLPDSLSSQGVAFATTCVALAFVVLTMFATHLLLHGVLFRLIQNAASRDTSLLHRILVERKLFQRVAYVIQGVILSVQSDLWLGNGVWGHALVDLLTQLWIVLFALLSAFSLIDALLDVANGSRFDRQLPLRGIGQSLKLLATLVASVLAVSLLIGKSPLLLMSGLGAMTAVIMLVFKDAILGFVAGIQLSANRMLSKGDWLEMAQYGADGSVIDIGLTTVKVQNWDHTITTIPTYALISDAFRNWRGMTESGGRRIKRSLLIDIASIRFLDNDTLASLRQSRTLSAYLDRKQDELAQHAATLHDTASRTTLDLRQLTNVGTFRAYLEAYLRNHPGIHQEMTLMVRQLAPSEHGLPIEIYAFTNTTAWTAYEGIQSDIFDHIYATLGVFGLRAYQSPTGHDLRKGLRQQAGAQERNALDGSR